MNYKKFFSDRENESTAQQIYFPITPEKIKEKSEEEILICQKANSDSNQLLTELGLKPIDISPDLFAFIKSEYWLEELDDAEGFLTSGGFVVMKERDSKIGIYETVFHETLHMKSRKGNVEQSIFFQKDNKGRVSSTNINEALTTNLTKSCMIHLKDDPMFKSEIDDSIEILKDDEGDQLNFGDGDIYRVSIENLDDEKTRVIISTFSYKEEREILSKLILKIFNKNPQFHSQDEISTIFAKGYLSGDSSFITNLIDKFFKQGTATKIKMLDDDIEALLNFINALN